MDIKTQKVLRLISKIILLVVGVALVGYVGLVSYKSIVNKPQRIRITNVTDSAATITWVTDNPVRGVVYYKTKDSVLSGPFGFLFSSVGYDDRDFAVAQEDCVNTFNENAKNTKDENFAVSGENFDCENIGVEKLGAYYTHSVTLKNLDESSTYFFKVGNGIWSWGINGVGKDISEGELPLATQFSFVTGVIPESVPTPNIAYGTVSAGSKTEEGYLTEALSKDSLVFAYLTKDGTNSQLISAVTNTDGGWVLDKSNLRDTDGKLISDLTGATMQFCAQYEDVAFRGCVEVTDGLNQDTTVDLLGNVFNDLTTYEKSWILQKFEDLVGKVYATSSTGHDMNKCTATGVSGCDRNTAKCIKKCPVTGTNIFDWVDAGTVANNDCSLPYSCGDCTSADNARGCVDGTPNDSHSKKCEAKNGAYFWTSYSNDNCGSGSSGGGRRCPDGHGGTVANKAQCPDGAGLCTDGVCVPAEQEEEEEEGGGEETTGLCADGTTKVDWCTTGSMKCTSNGGSLQVDDTCKCTDNRGKKVLIGGCIRATQHRCIKDGNGGVKVSLSTDKGCPDKEYCSDGKTQVGWCTTKSKKCSIDNRTLIEDSTCKCTDVAGELVPIGECIGTTQHKCVLENEYGLASISHDTFSLCPGPNETESFCTIAGKYDGEGNLLSCNVSCLGITTNIDKRNCLSYVKDSGKIAPTVGKTSPSNYINILVTRLYFESLTQEIIKRNPILTERFEEKLNDINASHANGGCADWTLSDIDLFFNYCGGLGKKPQTANCSNDQKILTCSSPSSQNLNILGMSKAYAEDATTSSYTLYLPEYGMYSFELGDYTVSTQIADGETIYMFYVEANETAGFQIPKDPDNPTATEDIIINSGASKITYTKKSVAQKYDIEKGINIVSFNFVPVATTLEAYTAKDIIAQGKKDGVTIKYISTFDGGRWNSGYSCLEGACTGNNFTIVPGKGYLIYATTEGKITIPGYNLTSSVPVPFSAGWNLVGIHGYTTAYTAQSLITSINKVQGLTANNVSWWPTSKSKYEGLQVDGETKYGLDFPISPTNGYFVRVAKFAPTDVKCKSLIWQASGKLNGVCGNTK